MLFFFQHPVYPADHKHRDHHQRDRDRYDEDKGTGLVRHCLLRRGVATGQVMVVLVTAQPVLPGAKNFVKALLAEAAQRGVTVTTVVQNVNSRKTSVVLGEAEKVLYGKGFILDTLCGKTYAISPRSFYQINHAQTEVLYGLAVEAAKLTGKEVVLDAYCGIGTIGLTAADHAKQVVGVELNRDAVQDAIGNARHNGVKNARFFAADATRWIREAAAAGEKADVIFMDPPREGSTPEFLASVARMAPKRVVYVSCNPVTICAVGKIRLLLSAAHFGISSAFQTCPDRVVIQRTFPAVGLLSGAQFPNCRILAAVVIDGTFLKKSTVQRTAGIVIHGTIRFFRGRAVVIRRTIRKNPFFCGASCRGLLVCAQFALQEPGLLSTAQYKDFSARVVIQRTFLRGRIFPSALLECCAHFSLFLFFAPGVVILDTF